MSKEAMKLEPCGGCYGSGWVTRDPDVGTDQECFVCGGSGACPKEPEQEPVAIKYWLQDTMESGRWVTTDKMAKATAERMLSGEYGDVYPQGRIVEPSPPAQLKPLTDEQRNTIISQECRYTSEAATEDHHRLIEAVELLHGIKEKNT